MPPVLVDLFCNDLEVGKSVTMNEVGPTSAYLEHGKPLPVGAEVRLHTEDGAEVGAVVVRVHEAVADAPKTPGMYVRVVEIAGDAEKWWHAHLDVDSDPVFPERALAGAVVPETTARTQTVDMTAEEIARMAAEDRTEASAAVPVPGPPPVDESAPNARTKTIQGVNTTLKMTADQVKAITDQAPPEKRNGTSMGMAVATPPPDVVAEEKPKKKKRRRKKKKP